MLEAASLVEMTEAQTIRQFVTNTMASSLINVESARNCSILVAKYGKTVETVVDTRYEEEVTLAALIDRVQTSLNYSDLGTVNYTEVFSFVQNYSASIGRQGRGNGSGSINGSTSKSSSLVLLAGTSGTEITSEAVSLAGEIQTSGTTLMPVVLSSASFNNSVSTETVARSLRAFASQPAEANLFVCSQASALLDVTETLQAQVTTGQ